MPKSQVASRNRPALSSSLPDREPLASPLLTDTPIAGQRLKDRLIDDYRRVRQLSIRLCEPLETEDLVVQPAAFVSPPKWHLAHTSWFFVNFLLHPQGVSCPWPNEHYPRLFNSYYKSQGAHWQQGQRGDLSRPTVAQILAFRKQVDEALINWLQSCPEDLPNALEQILRLGLAHEQQHQELLLMDIKYILWSNPELPAYRQPVSRPAPTEPNPQPLPTSDHWRCPAGLFTFGATPAAKNRHGEFCFDNETPQHQQWLPAFSIARRLTSNREYLAFIADGGYQRPELWLSEGWDWLQQNHLQQPLYWLQEGDDWLQYRLDGLQPLEDNAPVSHLSFYEAYAFARWTGKRLPSEYEWEVFARHSEITTNRAFLEAQFSSPAAEADPATPGSACSDVHGSLWQWTASPYSPYPGYRAAADAFGEYNGKFMINQMVLRGGCLATPSDHYRLTYRNFYQPHQRWPFTGLRLAEDLPG